MPHNLRGTAEALPVVVAGDVLHARTGQVLHDALFAEYVGTFRAAVNFTALATPTAVQLAAIFSLIELATVVEGVAVAAVRYP